MKAEIISLIFQLIKDKSVSLHGILSKKPFC